MSEIVTPSTEQENEPTPQQQTEPQIDLSQLNLPQVQQPTIAPSSLESMEEAQEPEPEGPELIRLSDYTPDQIEQLVSDYYKNVNNASFEQLAVTNNLQLRSLASNFARVRAMDSTKAANRKDWAAQVLGVPVEVVNANPEYAIGEAEVKYFQSQIDRYPTIMNLVNDPNEIKLFSVRDPEQFERARGVLGGFSNGYSIAQAEHEVNAISSQIMHLRLEGQEVPLNLWKRRNELNAELMERSQYGDGASTFVGNLLGSLVSSTETAASYGLAGAVGGMVATLEIGGVGAVPGFAVGITTGFAKDTIDQVRGQYYNELLQQGVAEPEALELANKYGLVVGGLSAGLDLVSGHIFGRALSAVKGAVTRTAMMTTTGAEIRRMMAEAGLNTLGGAVSGVGQTVGLNAALQEAGKPRALTEGVWESAYEGGLSSMLVGLALGSPSLIINTTRARRAQRQLQALRQLEQIASLNDLVKSNPDAAARVFNQMAQDAGGMSHVYMSSDALEQAMQAHPDDVQKLREAVPDLDQRIRNAKETGADIELDLGTWLAKIHETELGKSLEEFVRTSRDGLSNKELNEAAGKMGENAQQTIKEMAQKDADALRHDKALQEIKADLKAGLKSIGISEKNSNKAADLYLAFFDTMASRLGVDVRQFYKDLALKFARKPEGLNTRGSYDIASRTLFLDEHSDASTVVHEGAHFFLDVLTRIDRDTHQMSSTMDGLLKWFGLTREQWDALDTEGLRPYHEKFAEAWEQYLLNADAPSRELKNTFAFFSDWIGSVYRHVRDDGEAIPDDVRALFDSLIATDEQMEILRQTGVDQPLLEGETLNFLSKEEQAQYKTAVQEHFQALKEKLRAGQIKAYGIVRRKRERFLRGLERELRQLRKSYGLEAAVNVRNRPSYRLVDLIIRGKFIDGTENRQGTGRPMKLNRDALAPYVDKETLDALTYRRLVSKKGGMTPEEAVSLIGAPNANIRQLLKDISTQPAMRDAIRNEVDRLVAENGHAELLTVKGREGLADQAFAQVDADRMYSLEIRALLRAGISSREISRVAQAVADRVFNTFHQADVNVKTFLAAERRCNDLALRALSKGDIASAARHRYHALINRKLAKKAEQFKTEKTRMVQTIKQLRKYASNGNYDANWVIVAQAFAKRLGMYDRDIQKIPEQIAQDNPPVYQAYQQVQQMDVVPVEQMTTEQLHDAYIDLMGYVEKARQERRFTVRNRAEKLETAVKATTDTLKRPDMVGRKGASEYGTKFAPTKLQRARMWVQSARNSTKTAETLFEWLDGSTIKGARGEWTKRIFTPIREASTRGALRIQKARKALASAFTQMKLLDYKEPITYRCQATGETYTFNVNGTNGISEIIMLLMNAGNRDNWTKAVMGGRSRDKGADASTAHAWGEMRQDGTLNDTEMKDFIRGLIHQGILTREHFVQIQKIFDQFKAVRGDLQRAYFQVNGKYFKEIEGDFQLNDVLQEEFGFTIEGGYLPIVYDRDLFDIRADRSIDQLQAQGGNTFLPQTNNSFLKNRTATYLGGVSLGIANIDSALSDQIWYAEVQPALSEVSKLMRQPHIISELNRVAPNAITDIIQPWLMGIARNGKLPAPNHPLWTQIASIANTRATQVIMNLNIPNIAQQFSSLILGWHYAGTKNTVIGIAMMLRDMLFNLATLGRFSRSPHTLRNSIEAMSPSMKLRWSDEDNKIAKEIDKATIGGRNAVVRWWKREVKNSERGVYWGQTFLQRYIDQAVWYGAYNEFKEKNPGLKEADAVAYADSSVITTQSSNRPEDRAALQNVNSLFQRAFGMFFSFFVTQSNLQPAVGQSWARSLGLKNDSPMLFASYMTVLVIPMTLNEIIRTSLYAGWSDDDEEARQQILNILIGNFSTAGFATYIPYFGSWASAAIRYGLLGDEDVYMADSPLSSPGVSTAVKFAGVGWDALTNEKEDNDELDGRDVMNFMQFLSYVSGIGYPTMLARPVGGLYDMYRTGDYDHPFAAMFTGSVPKQK